MGNVVPSCTSPGYSREKSLSRATIFRDGLRGVTNSDEEGADDRHDDADVDDDADGGAAASSSAARAIRYQTRTEQDFFAKQSEVMMDSVSASSSSASASSLQILDPTQVMGALLEQAEELLRRETAHQNLLDDLENLLREDEDDDDEDSASTSTGSSSTSSSRASSSDSPGASASSTSSRVYDSGVRDFAEDDNHDEDDDDSRGDIFSNLSDTDLDSRLDDGGRSMATHTVLTTGTAATQRAVNHNVSNKRARGRGSAPTQGQTSVARTQHNRHSATRAGFPLETSTTILPLGTSSFAATQMLQSQIHSALSTHARRALSKPYLRSAERFQESFEQLRESEGRDDAERRSGPRSGPRVPPFSVQCGAALGNWTWLGSIVPRDPWASGRHFQGPEPRSSGGNDNNERVLRYMRALYLQLPSRSAAYMRRNPRLKRLLPENPVSLAHADPTRGGGSSLLERGYATDRDVRRRLLAESRGGSSDGVLAALSSSSSAAVPAMQLLTMSTSHSAVSDPHRVETYGDKGADDVEFETSADGLVSTPVRMWITNQVFLDLAVTGSLGWVRHLHPKNQPRSADTSEPYLALINRRSSVPLVVCTSRTDGDARGRCGGLTVLLHATKRRHSDQRPALTTRRLQGAGPLRTPPNVDDPRDATYDLPLYSWAKVVIEGCYPHRVTYAVHMTMSGADRGDNADDEEWPSRGGTVATTNIPRYESVPQYVAVHDSFRSPDVVVTGRTPTTKGPCRDYVGCAVISLCHRTGTGSTSHDGGEVEVGCDDEGGDVGGGVCTRVSVSARGESGDGGERRRSSSHHGGGSPCAPLLADPALMVCLAAIVDEFIEKSLQIESRGVAEAVYKWSQRAL